MPHHLWRKPPTRTQTCTRCGVTRTLQRTGPKHGWMWVYIRGTAAIYAVPQYDRQPLCDGA
jgi:hypothetical protein